MPDGFILVEAIRLVTYLEDSVCEISKVLFLKPVEKPPSSELKRIVYLIFEHKNFNGSVIEILLPAFMVIAWLVSSLFIIG